MGDNNLPLPLWAIGLDCLTLTRPEAVHKELESSNLKGPGWAASQDWQRALVGTSMRADLEPARQRSTMSSSSTSCARSNILRTAGLEIWHGKPSKTSERASVSLSGLRSEAA